MSQKLSIQDYYYQQKRIAETEGISENHAGCFITYYPNLDLCGKCPRCGGCGLIFKHEQDREKSHA